MDNPPRQAVVYSYVVRPNRLVLMPLPDFTDDERHLINCAKSTAANSQTNSYMWGYVVAGSVLAAFGAYQSSIPMLLSAFIVVNGFRIYEELFQSKWLPLWRSIIAKYEAACTGVSVDPETDGDADS